MSPLILACGLVAPAWASAQILVGSTVQVYQAPALDPMTMPTAVAAGPSGQVWVADGVSDRVLEFDASGGLVRSIEAVAGQPLSNPTAVAADEAGRLWIADSDHARVVWLGPGPGDQGELPIDLALLPGLDLTGVGVSPDGDLLWLVDNEQHRVLRGEVDAGIWAVMGSYGEGLGQLRHPFMVGVDDDGGAWVSDAIGARIVGWSAEGEARRPIGRFGVQPGQVFRPKGVAVQGDRVWVSDSTLGVIQAFSPGGKLLDVLRDEQGRILHLEGPTGLAVRGDRLFVVELTAHRVTELSIGTKVGQPYEAPVASVIGTEGTENQACSMCHLEMIPALSRGAADLLTSLPPNPKSEPYVSTEGACLSCHDGSVMDSRKAVWAMHGHPLGEPIPDDMTVPDHLPLVDGAMACRTCHSAHTEGGSGQVHRDALMVRVEDDIEELCVACHGDMQKGGGK